MPNPGGRRGARTRACRVETLLDTRPRVLWQYATEAGNPREARLLAVVLRDHRVVTGEMRFYDFAVGVLERAAGQHFGSNATTLKERDGAVSRALAWLASQGIPN
jgi:hypothetical protein